MITMTTNAEKREQERKFLQDAPANVRQEVTEDKQATFVNAETGEILSDRYDLVPKTTDNQLRGLQGNTIIDRHSIENGKFILAFFESAKLLTERFTTLSQQDIARLMFIGTYVAWETNRLQSDNGKQAYKKQDLQKLVGMSPKRFNELYKRYLSEGVLIEGDNGTVYMDKTVVYRGKAGDVGDRVADLNHTRLFRQTVRELYALFNGRKLGQLALVYSVIPFLNFNTNIICHNPEETATDEIKPITVNELAELLGYSDKSKLKAALNNVKLDDKPVFTFAEDPHDRREKRIIVNPQVVFAGNGEGLEAVKALFN